MGKRRTAAEPRCSIDGCDRPHEARSYCSMHYRRWKLYGDPLARAQRVYDLQCSADGCERPRRAGIWCTLHYQRVRKHGDANGVHYFRSIPSGGCVVEGCGRPPMHSSGMCEAHYKRWRTYGSTDAGINSGRCSSDGYIVLGGVRGHPFASPHGTTLEHRFVMATLLDRPLLPEENVHHVNGNRSDNRPENLELWSSSQPRGQRVADKVRWALEILALYCPDELKGSDMANSPSERWENGVLVERAIETNRWRVLPDGTEVGESEEVEAKATRPYKAPVPTKMMAAAETENKAVKATKATKK